MVTSSDVYWLIDTDYTDQDQTTLRRARLGHGGAVVTDVIPEKSDRATPAFGLTATDSAVTLTDYPAWGQVFEDPNDSLAKLYQFTPDGAPLGRVSCSVGQQSNAAADTGRRVLWMDTTTTDTDLVTRSSPARSCV